MPYLTKYVFEYCLFCWKLKTENNKKVTVWALVTVHMPDCTVYVPWTMQ